jgi:hypothetical protein
MTSHIYLAVLTTNVFINNLIILVIFSINVFADIYVKVNIIVARTKEGAEIELKDARSVDSPKKEKEEEQQADEGGDLDQKLEVGPKAEKESKPKKVLEEVLGDAVEEETIAEPSKKAKKSAPPKKAE